MARRNETVGLAIGFLAILGLHIIMLGIFYILILIFALFNAQNFPVIGPFFTSYDFLILFFIPGLTQLVYVIPLVIWCRRKRYWGTLKGAIAAAVITALLNGGCWLIAFSQV